MNKRVHRAGRHVVSASHQVQCPFRRCDVKCRKSDQPSARARQIATLATEKLRIEAAHGKPPFTAGPRRPIVSDALHFNDWQQIGELNADIEIGCLLQPPAQLPSSRNFKLELPWVKPGLFGYRCDHPTGAARRKRAFSTDFVKQRPAVPSFGFVRQLADIF